MRVAPVWLVGGLTALFVGVAAMPVGATVVDRGHYSGTDSFTYNDCGYPVGVDAEFSGNYRIRAGKHDDGSAFFLNDNYSYREVHTNLDTGEWFVVRGNGVFDEVGATRVEGSVFEFVAVEAGQPFVVEAPLATSCCEIGVRSVTGRCSTPAVTTSPPGPSWSSSVRTYVARIRGSSPTSARSPAS